jgi:hypothetical protein
VRLRAEPLWALSLYPDAGEGGGCLSVPRTVLPTGLPPNVDRAAEEAGRRARGKLRRYAAANRLNRLGTLTYSGEGCDDPRRLRSDLAGFFRELRAGLDAGGFRMCGCRSGILAATACTRISRSAGSCRAR